MLGTPMYTWIDEVIIFQRWFRAGMWKARITSHIWKGNLFNDWLIECKTLSSENQKDSTYGVSSGIENEHVCHSW